MISLGKQGTSIDTDQLYVSEQYRTAEAMSLVTGISMEVLEAENPTSAQQEMILLDTDGYRTYDTLSHEEMYTSENQTSPSDVDYDPVSLSDPEITPADPFYPYADMKELLEGQWCSHSGCRMQ